MPEKEKEKEAEAQVKVEEGVTDLLKSINSKLDSAWTEEKAKAWHEDYIKKFFEANPNLQQKVEKEEVKVKAGNRELEEPGQRRFLVDSFDHDNPSSLVEVHKSTAWERREEIKKAQEKLDDAYLVSVLRKCDPRQTIPYQELSQHIAKSELGKAMTTSGSGTGTEWVPTEVSRLFVDMVDRQFRLAQGGLFRQINMPRSPMQFYRKTSHATAYKGSEGTAVTASNVGTGNSTLTAQIVKVYVQSTEDLEEESIIALLPTIKDDMIWALANGVDTAIINGDTSDTHMDSDVTNAADCQKLWKGLRKTTAADCKLDLSTFNYQTVLRLTQKLGKYGEPNQCFWTSGVLLEKKLLNLKDEQNNPMVSTLDKLGPKATIFTGMIGAMAGSPIITSQNMKENLNAEGVYDGSTTTKALLLYTRKDAFCIGDRRGVKIETDKDITTGIIDLVATRKMIFEDLIVDTETTTAYGYNIDPNV